MKHLTIETRIAVPDSPPEEFSGSMDEYLAFLCRNAHASLRMKLPWVKIEGTEICQTSILAHVDD